MNGWRDDFDGPELDGSVWVPSYLPVWSSWAAAAASYRIEDSCLVLDLPQDHPLWCPEEHPTPLKVSGMMTGNHSGPVGSTVGQQSIFVGQKVREEQERFEGFLSDGGHLEVRCSMDITARSMAALWMCGFEDEPEKCGEICVVEIFGNAVRDGSAEVGIGLKQIRDPGLVPDFAAPRLPIDPAEMHTYAVDWDSDEAVFTVDGELVRRTPRPPPYPLQIMIGVFDFPDDATGDPAIDSHVPSMRIDWISE